MRIQDFADKYRLNTRLDTCGEKIIPGRLGDSHIYEYALDGSLFAVMLVAKGASRLPLGTWIRAKQAFGQDGERFVQEGEAEGAILFNPAIEKEARLAIKLAKIRRRKVPTPEQMATLRRNSF